LAKLRDELLSGQTAFGPMATERESSDTSEFVVTLPQGRRPSATKPVMGRGESLRQAYLTAVYEVSTAERVIPMTIGIPSPEIAALVATHGASGAAFITACNPPFLPVGSVHNVMAMKSLRSELQQLQYRSRLTCLNGQGRDREGLWPPEESVLVIGIDCEVAERLGRKFGQNAIVWIDRDGLPSLVELQDFCGTGYARRKNPFFPSVTLAVPWGYELAQVQLTASEWRQVLSGAGLDKTSTGYNDGEQFSLSWSFSEDGELWVEYGDGGTAYCGSLRGARLWLPDPA